jgi:hypothetical protein
MITKTTLKLPRMTSHPRFNFISAWLRDSNYAIGDALLSDYPQQFINIIFNKWP